MYLHDDGWTKAETDHLFDLCKRFDLRFIVVHDRYDYQQYRVMAQSLAYNKVPFHPVTTCTLQSFPLFYISETLGGGLERTIL